MKQEDFDRYCLKSGDDGVDVFNLIENEHGFCSFRIYKNRLEVSSTYGDGEYWNAYLTQMAKQKGCTKLRFSTRRNPKAFARKYGMKMIGYVLEKEVR